MITDDQDLTLGSMAQLPTIQTLLNAGGANLTSHMINTPICCPSRATMLVRPQAG